MDLGDFWEELRRRRVVRVVVAYAVAAFVVLQVAELTLVPLGLPEWTYRLVLVLTIAGFPVAVGLAWAFDVTPDGIQRTVGPGRGIPFPIPVWAVALVLLGGLGVGGWLLFSGSEELGAEGVDADLVAVIPFRVSSADQDVQALREGVLDLLAPHFSDAPRMLDVAAMVTAWRRTAGSDDADLSEDEAVELARTLGAGRLIVGSVVGTGERFTATARLIRVPGGSLVGDATIDGSTSNFGDLARRLSGAILALEAGEDPDRAEFLADVPNEALLTYLEGQRLYRSTAYQASREAFSRALDSDSTFALAAVGLRAAAAMGLDAARFDLVDRATRLIQAHMERLPSRDRDFMAALFGDSRGGRRNTLELISDNEAIARRFPDKAEAWYNLGDQPFHRAHRVALDDPYGFSRTAFDRALELDPGLLIVRQHRLWVAAVTHDTAYFMAESPSYNAAAAGTQGELINRGQGAFIFGDTADARVFRDLVAGATSFELAVGGGLFRYPGTRMPLEDVEASLELLDRVALRPSERQDAIELRMRMFRNAGRHREAERELDRLAAMGADLARTRLVHGLYWNGDLEEAREAATELTDRLGTDGAVTWNEGGRELCHLEVWRLRQGDSESTRRTIQRLSEGSDDSDPSHGQNALCVILLGAMLAEATGSADADPRVADLRRTLDLGPPSGLDVATLELARLLETRGNHGAASGAAYSPNDSQLSPNFYSTMLAEGARLAYLAGDRERALWMYRDVAQQLQAADPELGALAQTARDRVAELEGASATPPEQP